MEVEVKESQDRDLSHSGFAYPFAPRQVFPHRLADVPIVNERLVAQLAVQDGPLCAHFVPFVRGGGFVMFRFHSYSGGIIDR